MTLGITRSVESTVGLDESEYRQLGQFAEEFNITIQEAYRAAVLQMLWQDGYIRRNRRMDAETRDQPPRQFLMRWHDEDEWQPMDWPPTSVTSFAQARSHLEASEGDDGANTVVMVNRADITTLLDPLIGGGRLPADIVKCFRAVIVAPPGQDANE